MSEFRMRNIEIDGKRFGIRLDSTSWDTIDWIAKHQGRKWAAWAKEEIAKANDDSVNLTAVIREAAMRQIFNYLLKYEKTYRQSDEIIRATRMIIEAKEP